MRTVQAIEEYDNRTKQSIYFFKCEVPERLFVTPSLALVRRLQCLHRVNRRSEFVAEHFTLDNAA